MSFLYTSFIVLVSLFALGMVRKPRMLRFWLEKWSYLSEAIGVPFLFAHLLQLRQFNLKKPQRFLRANVSICPCIC